MQDAVLNLMNSMGLAWWAEVKTAEPPCTYYFGPFLMAVSAEAALPGYIEDLEQEGAIGIQATVKRCKPEQLTLDGEEMWIRDRNSPSST